MCGLSPENVAMHEVACLNATNADVRVRLSQCRAAAEMASCLVDASKAWSRQLFHALFKMRLHESPHHTCKMRVYPFLSIP